MESIGPGPKAISSSPSPDQAAAVCLLDRTLLLSARQTSQWRAWRPRYQEFLGGDPTGNGGAGYRGRFADLLKQRLVHHHLEGYPAQHEAAGGEHADHLAGLPGHTLRTTSDNASPGFDQDAA
jgi:hypothetical protein